MGMMRIQQMYVAAWLREHGNEFEEEPDELEAVKAPAAKPARVKAPSKKSAKKKASKKAKR